MCHHVFVYDEGDKNTNSHTNDSIKYISNTHEGVMQNEIYCNQIMKVIYFRVCIRIFSR